MRHTLSASICRTFLSDAFLLCRTDEFTVEVGGQLRILLVSKRYVVEADVTTGRYLRR